MGNKIIQGDLNVLGTISQNGSALPTVSGVMEFENKSAFPETGQTGVIYVDKSENVLYRWDSTASDYVGLAVSEGELNVEVLNFSTSELSNYTFTEDQIAKAKKGKLVINVSNGSGNLLKWNGCYLFKNFDSSTNIINFYNEHITFGGSSPNTYVESPGVPYIIILNLNCTTGKASISDSPRHVLESFAPIISASGNFFSSSQEPTQIGKKLVREQNIYGKIIPNYTSSDANKIVKINSAGTGVELDNLETATELDVNRLFRTEYPITTNITNGTTSGATNIWTKETAFVEIHPNAEYGVPQTVTVTGAAYNYSGAVITLSSVTGDVSIVGECTSLTPVHKGDIIDFDAFGNGVQKRFRVLNCDENNIAELLSLDIEGDTTNYYDNSSSQRTVQFSDGESYIDYADSNLDTYCNITYYNRLSTGVKAAIIDKNIVQSCYSVGDDNYDFITHSKGYGNFKLKKVAQHNIGLRHVYALDIDTFKDYFSPEIGGTIEGNDIISVFFDGVSDTQYHHMCIMTAAPISHSPIYHFYRMYGYMASFHTQGVNDNADHTAVAFTVDLSKIVYTVEE